MQEAERRIQQCISNQYHYELDLCHLKLTSLPKNLPDVRIRLYCYNNELKELPTLPPSIYLLSCGDNKLTRLPTLPDKLERLFCNDNLLVSLPVLPPSVRYLDCDRNPYLYISEKLTQRFRNLHETHNYPLIMQNLKLIYQVKKRMKRLLFSSQLQDHIDEYRYRPGNAGYLELTNMNKNKFIDL
jgi:hypothetical protein